MVVGPVWDRLSVATFWNFRATTKTPNLYHDERADRYSPRFHVCMSRYTGIKDIREWDTSGITEVAQVWADPVLVVHQTIYSEWLHSIGFG